MEERDNEVKSCSGGTSVPQAPSCPAQAKLQVRHACAAGPQRVQHAHEMTNSPTTARTACEAHLHVDCPVQRGGGKHGQQAQHQLNLLHLSLAEAAAAACGALLSMDMVGINR